MTIKKFKNNKLVFKRKKNETFQDFLYNGEIMEYFLYYVLYNNNFWVVDTEKKLFYNAIQNYNGKNNNEFIISFETQPSATLFPTDIDEETKNVLYQLIDTTFRINEDATYQIFIYTDGACKGNPGKIGIGGVLYDKNNNVLKMLCKQGEHGTNNVAEYIAVIKSLEAAKMYNPNKITVYSDSQLVMHQLSGYNEVNDEKLISLYNETKKIVEELNSDVNFIWIQRENNKIADALASRAIGFNNAIITKNGIKEWQKDENYICDNTDLLEPEPKNEIAIRKLNNVPNPKFKDFLDLKDKNVKKAINTIDVKKMLKYIEKRYGGNTSTYVYAVLNNADENYAINVLSWIAHGLNPDKAFKKVSVDIEMEINKKTKYSVL